jgi:hypothetical protein
MLFQFKQLEHDALGVKQVEHDALGVKQLEYDRYSWG